MGVHRRREVFVVVREVWHAAEDLQTKTVGGWGVEMVVASFNGTIGTLSFAWNGRSVYTAWPSQDKKVDSRQYTKFSLYHPCRQIFPRGQG